MSKSQRALRFVVAVIFAFLVITINTSVKAQTSLVAGDLAFSGYICNDTGPDRFSFVLLKTIVATTTIKFTDYGWRPTENMLKNNGILESEITFTATSTINAGKEITISGTGPSVSMTGGSGTVAYSVGASFLVGNLSLAGNGDQLLAYQGNFPTPTSFIAGIHMNVYTGAPSTTTAGAWDGDLAPASQDNNNSGKPPALTTGTNALWFVAEVDNARFTCGPNVSTAPLALAALNNPSNWQTNSVSPAGFGLPSACGFLGQPTAAPATVSGVVTTSDGEPLAGVSVSLSGTQAARTITDSLGQYRFSNVEANGFYTVTPALANHSFSPANRSFSLVGNKTDATFTATEDAAVANAIDTSDFFVRQQYLDFLGREPEAGGFNYWSEQVNSCNGDADCIRDRRIDVSAAFFMSQEFKDTGSFVYRLYRGALGRQLGYSEFSADRAQVVGGPNLEASKTGFVDAFVQRAEFADKYQANTTAESFVDVLLQTMNDSAGVNLSSERTALINRYHEGTSMNASRALVVRQLIDNETFGSAVYNQSFVTMQYMGYLRRTPETEGFNFWVNVLNSQPDNYRGMICSFITSTEYQRRFSSVVSHSNGECGQ